jgi:hypothetical protein
MSETSLRTARATGLVLLALAALPAAAGARPAYPVKALTLTIGQLPAGRSTIGQLAVYYYGAAQMSFVIQGANPWLEHVPPNRGLATYAGLARHRTIRIPELRGARPLGPI